MGYPCIRWQLDLSITCQIKVTMDILIFKNKKREMSDTAQEWICAKGIMSTCGKIPWNKKTRVMCCQFLQKHDIVFQMWFYFPFRYIRQEWVYFWLFITSGYCYLYLYASMEIHGFLTHKVCPCNYTLCTCDSS